MAGNMLDPELNRLPTSVEKIHLMGICGTGMAALAGMLKQAGYTVTGSDAGVYPPMSDFLEGIGIHPQEGYCPENLVHNPDLVIVGNVITATNPEAKALQSRRIPYLSLPQALAEFFIATRRSIVVAGTHGKTTTSSMLASSLFHAGLDPSYMIGGIVSEFGSNNRLARGPHFVVEGDEYDTAFFDKESKFLHYRPEIAIITSIEFDHADIFNDLSEIIAAFKNFVRLLPDDGLIIANLDDDTVAEVVASAACRVEGYGFDKGNDWRLYEPSGFSGGSRFAFEYRNAREQITIPASGRHNCLNALAVTAVLHELGIGFDRIADALSSFKGVKRRQEVRGVVDDITVIDDFAHHPTAVRETLFGLRQAYAGKRLVAVFEPRTNSSRRTIFQEKYAASFDDADLIVVREPVPLKNVAAEEHFSSARLAGDLISKGKQSVAFDSTDEILAYLESTLEQGDVVAILSNGGFDNIHQRLIDNLSGKHTAS